MLASMCLSRCILYSHFVAPFAIVIVEEFLTQLFSVAVAVKKNSTRLVGACGCGRT